MDLVESVQDKNVIKQKVTNEDIYGLLQKSIVQISEVRKEIKEIRRELTVSNERLESVSDRLHAVEKENEDLRIKLLKVEKRLKRNNIILFGIGENPKELVKNLVVDFVSQQLKVELDTRDIGNIYRISNKNTAKKPRPILLELVTHDKKREILNQRKFVKGSAVAISENLTEEDRKERKLLYDHFSTARKKGYPAKLFNKKVEINGKSYTYRDLAEIEVNPEVNLSAYSKSTSAPTTPSVETVQHNIFEGSLSQSSTTSKQDLSGKQEEKQAEERKIIPTRSRANSKSSIKKI